MAKYTGADCRLCRREGCKLYLKGEKCGSTKCPLLTKYAPPGDHGKGRKKASGYSIQLREKQKPNVSTASPRSNSRCTMTEHLKCAASPVKICSS